MDAGPTTHRRGRRSAQSWQRMSAASMVLPSPTLPARVTPLLARVGLRGGEIANLTLEDIDWEGGSVTVHGKTGRVDQLSLPREVGRPIAPNLKAGRHQYLDSSGLSTFWETSTTARCSRGRTLRACSMSGPLRKEFVRFCGHRE